MLGKTELPQFRTKILGDSEEMDVGRNEVLSAEMVAEFDLSLGQLTGYDNYKRQFFKMDAVKAVELGYKLTKRGYFEAAESPAAINTAKTLWKFLMEIGFDNDKLILELFTGTGQTAWAFTQEDFLVKTV